MVKGVLTQDTGDSKGNEMLVAVAHPEHDFFGFKTRAQVKDGKIYLKPSDVAEIKVPWGDVAHAIPF